MCRPQNGANGTLMILMVLVPGCFPSLAGERLSQPCGQS